MQKGKGMTEEEFRKGPAAAALDKATGFAPVQAEPLMQFFEYWPTALEREHDLSVKIMGNTFYTAAKHMTETLPRNSERTTALRKLLEARDCAMRAAVMK